MKGLARVDGELKLGDGAQFWVYLSSQNETNEVIKGWSVTISQGDWSDSITSENPTKQLLAPNLCGIFDIKITAKDYSTNPPREVTIPALPPSTDQIGCNANSISMIGIVADDFHLLGSASSQFWTTWDALCERV